MYDKRKIMLRAWKNYRKNGGKITFGEALHRAWLSAKAEPINASRIEAAQQAAGILEECRTWSEWKELGREVMHGETAVFGCDLIWGSRGDGATYKARFFGISQTAAIEEEAAA